MTGSHHRADGKCICAYDGTAFRGGAGRARRKAGRDSGRSRARLTDGNFQTVPFAFNGERDPGKTMGGRGHALRTQVFHFDGTWAGTPPEKLLAAFRTGGWPFAIPDSKSIHAVTSDFHAEVRAGPGRFSTSYPCNLWPMGPTRLRVPLVGPSFKPLDGAAMRGGGGDYARPARFPRVCQGAQRRDAKDNRSRAICGGLDNREARGGACASTAGILGRDFLYKMMRNCWPGALVGR